MKQTYSDAATAARMTHPFEQAQYLYRMGLISEGVWRWYVFFWVWSAPRFSNVMSAERKQDRAFTRLPRDAYHRRFERVNALRNNLRGIPRSVSP